MNNIKKIKKNILITGYPGIGKTTLIKKISEKLKYIKPAGFYTEEIREKGIRIGFDLISFTGKKGLLSHTDIKSPYHVGKYRVDVKGFEGFLESLPLHDDSTGIIIIDEIGKMECFSHKFIKLIKQIFDSDKLFIATISLKGTGLISEVKTRDDVILFEITKYNRNSLVYDVLESVHSLGSF